MVPDTLSGPCLRDNGSHVNLYGRAGGKTSGGPALTGVTSLEELDESSDMWFNSAGRDSVNDKWQLFKNAYSR